MKGNEGPLPADLKKRLERGDNSPLPEELNRTTRTAPLEPMMLNTLSVSPSRALTLELLQRGLLDPPPEPIREDGKLRYRPTDDAVPHEKAIEADALDRFKSTIKRLIGRHYIALSAIVSPVMPRIHWAQGKIWESSLISKLGAGLPILVQLGSGNSRLMPHMINVDIRDFREVDIVADGTRLPFRDESVDLLFNGAVLEHVEDPERLLREAHRILKPGGLIITGAPFIQAFHGSPDDFTRWTRRGLQTVHERNGFRMESVEPVGGPTSALLWILQEWLALFLSLGSSRLHLVWLVFLTVLTFPLKLLDLLLIHHPSAHRIASFHVLVARKT